MSDRDVFCTQEEQYCRWMAACKLASKGRTMADSSYESEVSALQTFLSMQHPSAVPAIAPSQVDIQPEDFIAPRFFRKIKSKSVSGSQSCLRTLLSSFLCLTLGLTRV